LLNLMMMHETDIPFCVWIRTNNDSCVKLVSVYFLTDLCNGDTTLFLQCKNWIYKYCGMYTCC
jgi:hypothetical protein